MFINFLTERQFIDDILYGSIVRAGHDDAVSCDFVWQFADACFMEINSFRCPFDAVFLQIRDGQGLFYDEVGKDILQQGGASAWRAVDAADILCFSTRKIHSNLLHQGKGILRIARETSQGIVLR